MLIGFVFSTSEIVREQVAFGALVNLISMADVDAIDVCYPHSEYVISAENEGFDGFVEVGVEITVWEILGAARMHLACGSLEADTFFGGVVFLGDVEDVFVAILPQVKDCVEGPLDDVGCPGVRVEMLDRPGGCISSACGGGFGLLLPFHETEAPCNGKPTA